MASPASTPSSTPSLPSLMGHVKIKKETLDHPHDSCKGEYPHAVLHKSRGRKVFTFPVCFDLNFTSKMSGSLKAAAVRHVRVTVWGSPTFHELSECP